MAGSIRLIIFASYYHPHIGGYEKNVQEMAERLTARGYSIDIVTCNTNNVQAVEYGDINIYRLRCAMLLNGTYAVPLPTFKNLLIMGQLLFKRYDAVNTQTRFFVTSFIGMLFAKIKMIPLVHTERGTSHSVTNSKLSSVLCRIYDHIIGRMIVKSAKINTAVSESARDFVRHIGSSKCVVIYNGIDTDVYKPSHKRNSDIVITYVGRLEYGKGVQDLIAAVRMIKKYHHVMKLVIVGDGSYKAVLQDEDNKAVFVGQKDKQGVIDILNETTIFVNPSYTEGLPTSVMEAAAMGLPIVATDVGGTNEIIEHNVSGILVKPGDYSGIADAVLYLLKDNKGMGDKAREHVINKFNWDIIISKMDIIYRNAAANKR